MWESVELREIRAFVLLAEELHFGRTAERLGLTQSRVSQVIRTLETRLGGPLFARTSRRVELTPLGARLRDAVREPVEGLERALADAYAAGRGITGELRLGVLVATSGGPALIEIIETFEAHNPGSRVQIVELALSEALEPLRRGEVDLMAIRLPITQQDLTVGPVLSSEPRVLAVSTDHRLAALDSVSVEQLAEETVAVGAGLPPELLDDLVPPHTPGGQPIPRSRPIKTLPEILATVARGELVHLTVPSLQDYYGHPGVTYVPIRDMSKTQSALIWPTVDAAIPALDAFVTTAELVLSQRAQD